MPESQTAEDLRYPVGPFVYPTATTAGERREWISDIDEAPRKMRAAVAGLTPEQLDTPYRPEGWTVRQVVHHVPDSHLNAYTRLKLALTEDTPTIKPYDEVAWANLPDVARTPIETSLVLLESLHDRWVRLLEAMSESDFARTLRHPEVGTMNLGAFLASYAWHSRHHVAHITSLRARKGW